MPMAYCWLPIGHRPLPVLCLAVEDEAEEAEKPAAATEEDKVTQGHTKGHAASTGIADRQ